MRRALALAAVCAASCAADALAIDIVKIEEFWELQIGEPDGPSSSPQVLMVVSPTGDLATNYFVFTLNHRSHPDYEAGGMQVQQWNDETLETAASGSAQTTLDHTDDTISWVQELSLSGGQVAFEVRDGSSHSWGTFGGDGQMRLSINSAAANLNDYRPAISIEQSGVSFAGNRVRSLTLTRLRWTDSTGQVYELVAPIDVDADLDP